MSNARKLRRSLVDLADRAGATFAQAFFAAVALGGVVDLDTLKLAAAAGGLAVAKYVSVKAHAYLQSPEEMAPDPEPEPKQ